MEICSGGPDGDDFTIALALHLDLFYPAMTMRGLSLSVLALEASVPVLGSSASGHLCRERQWILLPLPQHLLTLHTTYYHYVSVHYELVKVCCILRTFILHDLREHGDDQTQLDTSQSLPKLLRVVGRVFGAAYSLLAPPKPRIEDVWLLCKVAGRGPLDHDQSVVSRVAELYQLGAAGCVVIGINCRME
jgi:hypothetical protein